MYLIREHYVSEAVANINQYILSTVHRLFLLLHFHELELLCAIWTLSKVLRQELRLVIQETGR